MLLVATSRGRSRSRSMSPRRRRPPRWRGPGSRLPLRLRRCSADLREMAPVSHIGLSRSSESSQASTVSFLMVVVSFHLVQKVVELCPEPISVDDAVRIREPRGDSAVDPCFPGSGPYDPADRTPDPAVPAAIDRPMTPSVSHPQASCMPFFASPGRGSARCAQSLEWTPGLSS